MKIGILQFSPIWESKIENMKLIEEKVNNIESNTDMLIFPEMTLTGFTMKAKDNAEEIDGESINFFINLASQLRMDLVTGIVERDNSNFYNSLFHFDSRGLIKAIYRKIHPFSMAEEDMNYSSGKEIVLSAFETHKIGLSICYDLRFPELYRLNIKDGAEMMINIANWPVKRIDHWNQLLKARAIENQCFIIGVNRIGNDPYQTYNGNSGIYDPMGHEVIKVNEESEIVYAEINLDYVKEVREKLGFLNDIKLI